jgi:hypothetical protein
VRRHLRRIDALLAALLLSSCSAPPRVSVLVIRGEGTPEIGDLTRLRLIVRTCDSNQPALAQNVPLTDPEAIEGPVVPGTSFYVWLQGWEPCNPPCIPEGQAQPNDCTCVGDEVPPAQIFKYEACTDWLEANANVRRTLTLAPKADPPLCPPAPLTAADCMTP